MHEAGLAIAIVDALRARRRDGARVRLLVTGGHGDARHFDDALRLHLAALAPELDRAVVEIVHLPIDRPCLTCGRPFAAIRPDDACPRCGDIALSIPVPERVDIELVRGDDSTS